MTSKSQKMSVKNARKNKRARSEFYRHYDSGVNWDSLASLTKNESESAAQKEAK